MASPPGPLSFGAGPGGGRPYEPWVKANRNMKTLRLHLQSLPPYTPLDACFYLAGDFNDWQPADERYRFQPCGDGSYELIMEAPADQLSCKITRGHWSTAEGDRNGAERPNRVLRSEGNKAQLWLHVESWTDFPAEARQHTSAPNVVLLHPGFEIPQLGRRRRRVWAYLPPDYWTTQQRYPVLYMQDGQNLFDTGASFSGEWGVDKALNRLFHRPDFSQKTTPVIVIGVENEGEHRINEYSAWRHAEYGGGEGSAYVEFLCNTLKPFIDKRLRTLPGRENTAVLGSSMGGLLSLYAAMERPDVFGMAGIFSPSLWFSKEILPFVRRKKPAAPVRILLMAGQRESDTMVSDLLDLFETLLEAGHDDANLHYDLHADGAHAEWFWAREFEHAFSWLFGAMPGHRHGSVSSQGLHFRVDERAKELIIQLKQPLNHPLLEVRDYCHDRHWEHPLAPGDNRIPYAVWENCLYSLRIHTAGDLVFSRRVHLNDLPKEVSQNVEISYL